MGAHLATFPARPPAGALTMVVPRRARTLPLRTSAAYVAVGTGVSRVTGLLRFVALAWALGQTTLADSYNLANTTPNMLYDVVLGGVLSATFIPVFVDRLANKSEREAFDSISAVLTVSVVVLLATTLAALVAAPFLIDALTVLDTHAGANQVHRVLLERQVATGFLRWFVIEIAAYGLFALAAALLNTRRRFIAVAWAPIVNNFVCIGILVWFGLWAGRGASLAGVEQHHTQLVLLGLGTSLGVVLQGVALIPSLRRADLGLLRWRWNPRDEALRAVTRLGGWTFGFVLANQIALFVVTILAGSVAGPDPVSSYTYAYAFFQLPYGIVAVTVMSVVTPDLAERWSTGQQTAFLHRMTGGLRAVLALIIPSAVGILLLAKPAVALLLGNGHSTPAETATTGAALAMFALGLPGSAPTSTWCRVLQSMQRTRVAFYLYLVENALNIVLALAARPPSRRTRPRPLAVHRLHRVGVAGPRRLPPVVRASRRARLVGAAGPRPHRLRAHGRGRSRGVEPLGVDQRGRPAGPCRRIRRRRQPDLRRGGDLAGPAPRRAAATPVRPIRPGRPTRPAAVPPPVRSGRVPPCPVEPVRPARPARRHPPVASPRPSDGGPSRPLRPASTRAAREPPAAPAVPRPPPLRARLAACPASTS